jgi:antitoxin HigA-1
MYNPPHPGEILQEFCLEPLQLSITSAAKGLGISRKTLSHIINGRARITAEIAVRLSLAFGRSAKSWLDLQTLYDLAAVESRRSSVSITRFVGAEHQAGLV